MDRQRPALTGAEARDQQRRSRPGPSEVEVVLAAEPALSRRARAERRAGGRRGAQAGPAKVTATGRRRAGPHPLPRNCPIASSAGRSVRASGIAKVRSPKLAGGPQRLVAAELVGGQPGLGDAGDAEGVEHRLDLAEGTAAVLLGDRRQPVEDQLGGRPLDQHPGQGTGCVALDPAADRVDAALVDTGPPQRGAVGDRVVGAAIQTTGRSPVTGSRSWRVGSRRSASSSAWKCAATRTHSPSASVATWRPTRSTTSAAAARVGDVEPPPLQPRDQDVTWASISPGTTIPSSARSGVPGGTGAAASRVPTATIRPFAIAIASRAGTLGIHRQQVAGDDLEPCHGSI